MRTILALLVIGLISTAAFAVATDADCEAPQRDPNADDSDRDRVSVATESTRSNVNGGTGVCEGEQWDGGDTTGATESGTGVWILDPNDRIDRVGVRVGGTTPSGSNKPTLTDPLHLRVIGQGSPGWKEGTLNVGDGTLYAFADIWGVGGTGVTATGHQDQMPCVADGQTPCSPTSGSGADGAMLGTLEVAWYGEDNTDQSVGAVGLVEEWDAAFNAAHAAIHSGNTHDSTGGNVLASVIHIAHVTQASNVDEEGTNCTHESYAQGACTRDNTAVTVELLA